MNFCDPTLSPGRQAASHAIWFTVGVAGWVQSAHTRRTSRWATMPCTAAAIM
jgi:hypothetical protein